VHYTGTLTNGQVFDSSHKRGRPFTFTVGIGQVIRGWGRFTILGSMSFVVASRFKSLTFPCFPFADEGFLDMEVGEKAMLRITSDYAYGPNGAGGVIPPNADLNFEVCIYNLYDQLSNWFICHPSSNAHFCFRLN